jgi:hypothetical protein
MGFPGLLPQFRYTCGNLSLSLPKDGLEAVIRGQRGHLERIPGGEIPQQFDFSEAQFQFSRAPVRE